MVVVVEAAVEAGAEVRGIVSSRAGVTARTIATRHCCTTRRSSRCPASSLARSPAAAVSCAKLQCTESSSADIH